MFYLPVVTDSPIFANAARRLRNLKVFIPFVIAVIAYAVIIAFIIASQAHPSSHESPATTLPPGGQAPNTPGPSQASPPAGTNSPTQPATTGIPGATTTSPGGPSTTTKAPTTTPTAPTIAPNVTTIKPPTTTPQPTVVTPRPPTSPTTTAAPTNGSVIPPAELNGKRGFCFRNSCSEPIWISQIGGATGLPCAGGCPAGTICNTVDATLGCYFSLPFPAPGKVKMTPGQLWCLSFDFPSVTTVVHMPTGDVHLDIQWSGALYASTNCDDNLNCQSAVCKACDENMVCKECASFQGPVGPVTQAELTLSNVWKDYYDTTLIQGANLPMVIKPMSYTGGFYPDTLVPAAYHCGQPGHPGTIGDSPASSWKFDSSKVPALTSTPPLIFGGSGQACTMSGTPSNGCPSGEVCGVAMQLNQWNQPMPLVFDNICGNPIGVWSRNEVCGWTDSYSYANCKSPAPSGGGTVMDLYKCSGPYAESCIQPTSDSNCCGCTVWPDFIPTHGDECKHTNPAWTSVVQPHLEIIKRACPTCYTFPYDDSTALYTCWDDPKANYASYEFEWCPSGTSISF